MNFNYYMPTRLAVGKNCIQEQGDLIKPLGSKAFIMTGKSSAERNGSLKDMTSVLDRLGIQWLHYNRVNPNPSLEEVRSASEDARGFEADMVIALGGGSPMDAAKAVAVLAGSNISDDQLLSLRTFPKVLPLVTVPTTAGTGSEVTPYSILTNNKLETKSFLVGEQIFPALSYLDGRYMMDLPMGITANTTVDALSHSAEGFLAQRATPMSRYTALESLRTMAPPLKSMAKQKTLTLEDRQNLLYASTLAGMVIAQSGTTAVHAMGYSLTYFKGMDHGLANGLLFAEYLRYLEPHRKEDIAQLLNALALRDIDELDTLLKELLGDGELSPEEVNRFSEIAIKAGNIANTKPQPSQKDLHNILSNCFIK